jgi:hypothetical protein
VLNEVLTAGAFGQALYDALIRVRRVLNEILTAGGGVRPDAVVAAIHARGE